MIHLLRSEIFRLRKRPQAWLLPLILISTIGAVYAGVAIAATVLSDSSSARNSLRLSSIFAPEMHGPMLFVAYLLCVVLAAGLIGSEYSWNTIRPLLARSRSRNALLSAKWITVFVYTVLLFLAGLLATILFSVLASWLVGDLETVTGTMLGDWIISYGRLVWSQWVYIALTFCIALVTRSNAVGIAVGIAFAILESTIWLLIAELTENLDTVRKFGLEYPSNLLVNMNMGSEVVSVQEAWFATAVLGAWTGLFVALTYYFFNKRDVTSG